ncbi:DNA recombination protein RmuC [Vulcaniibacterium gelatinicum]|uniref:DNA recombination protein RmuC n=1 Tax=Vulcaniibacterium gelatinicum TaxID=2598725 RepID=UPI0011C77EC5|nr:DNA recombination protein RmuC [Vulcaniibacterium gelatinicum]
MELVFLVLAAGFGALLVYVAMARQARSAEAERARLADELQRERHGIRELTAEVARLGERAGAVPRLEAERDQARGDAQREAEAAHRARAALEACERELAALAERLRAAEHRLEALRDELERERKAHAEARAHLQHSERANQEMREFLANAQERLSAVFADLAGKTFDERAQRAAQQSKSDLETLLKPFSEQIVQFRQRVDTVYGDEAKERRELLGAVQELRKLNQEMATQAAALTRALKGSAKVRGDWGELMLESVLRGSGLEEGAHYERQKSTADDEGRRLQPDIVIRLPDERRIVVDSKVNLVAWQEAMNADTPEQQLEAMRRHAAALRQHVRDLGERNYPKALGDSALDITIAFVPIEGALSAALGVDEKLQTDAFERKVVFASPNTLMAMLRVVERLWTRDKIQKQARAISQAGEKLLDALVGFLKEFDEVGGKLKGATDAFHAARNRLSESRQAVIPRARRLVELGVRGRKALPDELTPEAPAAALLSSLDGDDQPDGGADEAE